MSDSPDAVVDWVERLHAVVDELAAPIAAANAARLTCRAGCSGCCTDGLTVFAIEAAVLERHYADLLASGDANESGGCAFLDRDGACRVYAHRPYVCRTQGLPLRWMESEEEEGRDICPLNEEGPPLEELAAEDCWTIGPIEERLATQQKDGRRVALRSMFVGARARLPIVR